ncbi:DUF1835 domain-containing protein [Pedobacter sp. ASV28]|uniref:DUF1835 domain-containing protein n=1 Tax=Pedobacter sp. ASV28 TaxID=2795123 RepID=UPI0018ED77EF|nr:DUF1835 domain-containing protein [Pedobacter sp. ASV28]
MPSKTLHILNGEATLTVFRDTGIKGEVLVWNEVLAQGPVALTKLWNIRANYICENYKIDKEDYTHKVLKEVRKLDKASIYEDIILWFEFDLVCQINLCYILSHLYKTNALGKIHLICPDSFNGIANFNGLGQLNPKQLESLLATKVLLQPHDFIIADKIWKAYANQDISVLTALLYSDFGNLAMTKPALTAYLQTFASNNKGLNIIEQFLLEQLNGGNNKKEALQQFWNTYPIYGFTDLHLSLILEKLKKRGFIKD